MNTAHKSCLAFMLTTMSTTLATTLLSLMSFVLMIPTGNAANAQQCYSDVQQAYAHLLAQDKVNDQRASAGFVLPVNINSASEAELTTLKGIGSNKAKAIILYRNGFGRFNSIDELSRVKGIGQKTVDKNRARLRVD